MDEKKDKKIVGFTCGVFDLTHAGHYIMFAKCKKQCDYLVVGIQTDPTRDRPKKNKPIQTTYELGLQVQGCRFVDSAFYYDTEEDLLNYLKTHEINVRFLGEDWMGKEYTGWDIEYKHPVQTVFLSRQHNYSSSNLRERIKNSEKKNEN